MSRFVMVTTEHRGVFAGELVKQDGANVTLADVRMCVYWARSVRGVVGLAVDGPCALCKVTKAAPQATLSDVTGIFDVAEAARARWESEPWG